MNDKAKQRALAQLEDAISRGEICRESCGDSFYSSFALYSGFRTAAFSAMHSIYGENHRCIDELEATLSQNNWQNIEGAVALLDVTKAKVQNDWLRSERDLISEELFIDFVEMAEYYTTEGHKDAAAVIAGAALESHIKKLCHKHGIDIIEKKGDRDLPRTTARLNDELHKASVYKGLDHKLLMGWMSLRNHAAHGDFNAYKIEDVLLMISGIKAFIAKTA